MPHIEWRDTYGIFYPFFFQKFVISGICIFTISMFPQFKFNPLYYLINKWFNFMGLVFSVFAAILVGFLVSRPIFITLSLLFLQLSLNVAFFSMRYLYGCTSIWYYKFFVLHIFFSKTTFISRNYIFFLKNKYCYYAFFPV